MPRFDQAPYHHAVFFMVNDSVSHEMIFQDFQSMLNHRTPLPLFRGRKVRCAYVALNDRLDIAATVLFRMGFDKEGQPGHRRIPLAQLIQQTTEVNHLGAGPVSIYSRNSCSDRAAEAWFWNADDKELARLQTWVYSNRLGLHQVRSAEPDDVTVRNYRPVAIPEHRRSKPGLSPSLVKKYRRELSQLWRDLGRLRRKLSGTETA